jgi:hypothetical protein
VTATPSCVLNAIVLPWFAPVPPIAIRCGAVTAVPDDPSTKIPD